MDVDATTDPVPVSPPARLPGVLDDVHRRADALLAGGPTAVAAAVALLSAHLVAVDRVLYGARGRGDPGGRGDVAALRATDHTLQQALCRVDRRLTGDVHLAGQPLSALVQQVRSCLEEHAHGEQALVDGLLQAQGVDSCAGLAQRLLAATRSAPTRPHPHTRHSLLSSVVARVDALVDHVRDAMDNRVVAFVPPPRAPHVPGRWGRYLTGQAAGDGTSRGRDTPVGTRRAF